jgi:hypothetical protein
MKEHAAAIWQEVKNDAYPWNIPENGATARNLHGVAPEAVSALRLGDAAKVNCALREALSPILRSQIDRRFDVCSWVVRNWGGIWAIGPCTMNTYAAALGDGNLLGPEIFINNLGDASAVGLPGISSWSKIFAFAHPEHHAIYDSRTAVAINLIVRAKNDQRRFGMPNSRNVRIRPARDKIVSENVRSEWLGYHEYIELLKEMTKNGAPSILAAEMALFAAAPRLAEREG